MGVNHRVYKLPPNSSFYNRCLYGPPVARGREVMIAKLRMRHVKASLGSSPQRARLHPLACDLEQVGRFAPGLPQVRIPSLSHCGYQSY
jgi:hypothetical protein